MPVPLQRRLQDFQNRRYYFVRLPEPCGAGSPEAQAETKYIVAQEHDHPVLLDNLIAIPLNLSY
ncbi:MAG: hypothetical protein PHI56_09330, partial [Victivallaceae bacterium]|nr:hypothetical protein [Victivallaceae bacterium]